MRKTALIVMTLLLSLSRTSIASVEFKLFDGDKAVRGAKVCFFPAATTKGERGILRNGIVSNDVRCLSADDRIELPRARFNIVALHSAGLLSPVVLANWTDADADCSRTIALPLRKAAVVDLAGVKLAADEYVAAVVYEQGITYVVPQTQEAPQMFVPTELPVVPILVKRGLPYKVGRPRVFKSGDHVAVQDLIPPSKGRTLLVEIGLPAELAAKAEYRSFTPALSPIVELEASGRTFAPAVALDGKQAFRNLLIFTDVPADATAIIRLRGTGWTHAQDAVSLDSTSEVVVLDRLLPAIPDGVGEKE